MTPVRRASFATAAVAAAALAACGRGAAGGGGGATTSAPDARIEALERRVAAAEAQQRRLAEVLRSHGIVFRAEPPAGAADAIAQALDDLDAALERLETAKAAQDTPRGQTAMTAVDGALEQLRREPAIALPQLLARAEAAPSARQAALLECYARVGGPVAAPALRLLATDASRPPALRSLAARALVGIDALAGIPAITTLLQEPTPVPDLYLLVHLLAATGRAEAMPVLVHALRASGDRSVRCHAATGLGGFPVPAAVDALAAAAIGDEYPAVRCNALRALARAADAERTRAVAAQVLARDADASVRAAATELAAPAKR